MCWSHHYGADGWYYDSRRRTEHRRTDPVKTPSQLRVSDAERHEVIEQLRHHTGEGRLTLEEFEARVEEALGARTGADLRKVLRELPPRGQSGRSGGRRQAAPVLRPLIAMASVVALIWLVFGVTLLAPVVVGIIALSVRNHRRPAPSLPRACDRDEVTTSL